MRKVLVVFLATFSLVLAITAATGAALANAATKPAYVVSLKLSTTSSQAGKFIVAGGKVVGPKAAGRSVVVQRKYADQGGWVTVATAVVRKNGTYAARVETPRGGDTSFRVLKARSSVRKAGTSPVRSTKVFQWLSLVNQPAFVTNVRPFEVTIGGVTYHHSLTFGPSNDVTFKPSGLCTAFTTHAGYDKPGAASDPKALNVDVTTTPSTGPSVTTSKPVATDGAETVTASLVGAKYLDLQLNDVAPGGYQGTLGDPQVYCNASSLPEFTGSDV